MEEKNISCDEELWHAFLSGDKEAISELFIRYYDDLYRYGLKINPDDDVVRDGIQDLFLGLWKKRAFLGQAVSVRKYLTVSLRRILFRQQEQYSSYKRHQEEYLFYRNVILPADEFLMNTGNYDQSDSLNASLTELTKRQREVLYLKFYDGYNNREIADITSLTYQRVCNIIHEGILKLRSIML